MPVVVYLIFFTIELIKINITQDALQSICEEATYLTIAHDYSSGPDLVAKIDAIVEKYRPSFIPKKMSFPEYESGEYAVIRWYYDTYTDLDEMLKNVPYGGSCIHYPKYNTSYLHATVHYMGITGNPYIPSMNMQYIPNPENFAFTSSALGNQNDGLPSNRVFVITITCNYQFSNSIVKWLFNGGMNTKIGKAYGCNSKPSNSHVPGTMYLLWSRGAGIVNAK